MWPFGKTPSVTTAQTEIFVSADILSIREGQRLAFTIERKENSNSELELNLQYSEPNIASLAPANVTIPAGSHHLEVDFMLSSDGVYRSRDVDFTVTVSALEVQTKQLDFKIQNADPFPYLSALSQPFAEGETASINFSLDRAADVDLLFHYSIADDSTTPADYDATSGNILFSAGETSSRLEIPLTTNSVCSLSKRFYVRVSPPAESSQGTVQAEQVILEKSAVVYSLNSISLTEGTSGNLTLSSDLTCPFARTLTLSSNNGTAIAGTNYAPMTSFSVTLPVMASTVQVPVATLNDNMQSPTKSFSVNVDATSYGTVAGSGTVNILDNNPTPTITWSLSNSSAARSSGAANIAWSLSAASGYTITATVDLAGTGVIGTDYQVAGVTLSIPPGTISGSFPISLLAKNTYNGNQSVALSLTALSHANIGARPTHTLTITDTMPAISISAPSKVIEGGSVNFDITLSKASASDITVSYQTQNGSASSGVDFDSLSGILTIPSGQTSATLSVQTIDNATACQIERNFSLVLSSPSGASLSTATATTAIEENDYPSLTMSNISVTEGHSANLTATLSQVCPFDVQFSWETANGTALAGTDYYMGSGALIIPAGENNKTISIATIDDNLDQGNLSFVVNLSNPSKLNLSTTSVTVTILDNETAPQLSFAVSSATALESVGQYSLEVKLDHPTIQNVTAALSFSGTAVYGTDYTLSAVAVNIPAGLSSTVIQISPVRGSGGKEIILNLGSPSRGTLRSPSSFNLTLESNPFTGPLIVSSADSSRLLYLSSIGSQMPLALAVPGSAHGNRLSKAAADGPKVTDFAFTGDQSRAVFISNNLRSSDQDLFSIRVDGSSLLQLNPSGWGSGREVKKMKPIGSGQRIVFMADRVSGGATKDLYAVNADSSSLTNMASAVNGTKTILDFEVAPNGSKVVFLSDYQGAVEIYSVNSDGTGFVKINSSLGSGAYVANFAITPDSSKVIYTVIGNGGEHLLYASPIGSGSMTLLNTVANARTIPSFKISPDSNRVAYLQNVVSTSNFDLYCVNINGSSRVQINQNLVSGGDVVSYDFSPNSLRLFYIAETQILGSPELYSAALDGSNRYKLSGTLPAGGKIVSASFTPNSSYIVYLGMQDSSVIQEIYAVDAAGSSRVKLNTTPVASGKITRYLVTNDSSKVIYLGDQDIAGISEIYSVGINGGSRQRISPAFGAGKKADMIFLLPSNSRLLYRANQNDGLRFDWFSMDLNGGNTTPLFGP